MLRYDRFYGLCLQSNQIQEEVKKISLVYIKIHFLLFFYKELGKICTANWNDFPHYKNFSISKN